METTNCQSCGRAIRFLTYVKTGKSNPIDADPSPDGNVAIDETEGTYTILTKKQLDEARAARDPLYLSHFTTCPDAKTYRKPTTKPKAKSEPKLEPTPEPTPDAAPPAQTLPDDLTPELAEQLRQLMEMAEIFGNTPFRQHELKDGEWNRYAELSKLGYIHWLMAGDTFQWKIYPKAYTAFGKDVPAEPTEPTSPPVAEPTPEPMPEPTPEPPPTVTVTIQTPSVDDTPPDAESPETVDDLESMILTYKDLLRTYRDDVATVDAALDPIRTKANAEADAARRAILDTYEANNRETLDTLLDLINNRDSTDDELRAYLIKWHKLTGKKTFDGELQVAELKRNKIIDKKAATEWARQNAPFCLVLDEKKFLETFGDDEHPFLDHPKTYSAKIATKLSPPQGDSNE